MYNYTGLPLISGWYEWLTSIQMFHFGANTSLDQIFVIVKSLKTYSYEGNIIIIVFDQMSCNW